MTIQEVIDRLNEIPESERGLTLYVCNSETNDNFVINSITKFDSDEAHSKDNVLGCNFNTTV